MAMGLSSVGILSTMEVTGPSDVWNYSHIMERMK